MKKRTLYTIAVIVVFILSVYGRLLIDIVFDIKIYSTSIYSNLIINYLWWIIPVLLLLTLSFGPKSLLNRLSLDRPFIKAFLFALIFVFPMLLGALFSGQFNKSLRIWDIIEGAILAGFFEELIFRGFLFGQLFRNCNWGFIPAASLNAVLFGLGHIYQGSSFEETLGVFLVTLSGGIWFAWLYAEWNNNIWMPVCMHVLMNFSWMITTSNETALGSLLPNVFRVLTIAISIVITIKMKENLKSLRINKSNLWVNKSSTQ